MYGLVNRAIRDMVVEGHGEDAWEALVREVGCPHTFVGMNSYPDAHTYGLVSAASKRLGARPEDLLRAFGRYWILYTAREGYGSLLDRTGATLAEFLENLDDMHARIAVSMPELKPPSFDVEQDDEGAIHVRYYSEREGLTPMVLGLLEGLVEKFSVEAEVQHRGETEDGGESFVVRPT